MPAKRLTAAYERIFSPSVCLRTRRRLVDAHAARASKARATRPPPTRRPEDHSDVPTASLSVRRRDPAQLGEPSLSMTSHLSPGDGVMPTLTIMSILLRSSCWTAVGMSTSAGPSPFTQRVTLKRAGDSSAPSGLTGPGIATPSNAVSAESIDSEPDTHDPCTAGAAATRPTTKVRHSRHVRQQVVVNSMARFSSGSESSLAWFRTTGALVRFPPPIASQPDGAAPLSNAPSATGMVFDPNVAGPRYVRVWHPWTPRTHGG